MNSGRKVYPANSWLPLAGLLGLWCLACQGGDGEAAGMQDASRDATVRDAQPIGADGLREDAGPVIEDARPNEPELAVADAQADGGPPDLPAAPPDQGRAEDGAVEDGGTPGLLPEPMLPVATPFWTVIVPLELEDRGSWPFLLDTGAPATMLAKPLAEQFPGRTLAQVRLGPRTHQDVPFSPYDLELASGLLGVGLGGIVGYSLLRDQVVTVDYRTGRYYPLEAWHDDYQFGPHVAGPFRALPFTLASQFLIVIRARFEGEAVERSVILDTGTSSSVVSQALFDALGIAQDGRTVLHGSRSIGATGEADSPVFRLRAFAMGDCVARKMWASLASDQFFDMISMAAGTEIVGIIGGTFLREFVTAIDYPAATLRLAPYADLEHIDNEFRMVGVEVVRLQGEYRIYTVFTGSDADRQQIARDDILLELDGQAVGELAHAEVLARLRGEVGTRVAMKLRQASGEYTVNVLREDLLPDL